LFSCSSNTTFETLLTSDEIRTGRIARGLTQNQAAERVGVSRGTWLAWETGRHKPAPRAEHDVRDLLELDFVPGSLEDARRRLGLTQKQIGDLIGVTAVTVSHVEAGNWPAPDLERWGLAYGLEADVFEGFWRAARCPG